VLHPRLDAPKLKEVIAALEALDPRLTFKLSELSSVLRTLAKDSPRPSDTPPTNPRPGNARHAAVAGWVLLWCVWELCPHQPAPMPDVPHDRMLGLAVWTHGGVGGAAG
jgi:hypothetical protein